jgi:hypothetical protein
VISFGFELEEFFVALFELVHFEIFACKGFYHANAKQAKASGNIG